MTRIMAQHGTRVKAQFKTKISKIKIQFAAREIREPNPCFGFTIVPLRRSPILP